VRYLPDQFSRVRRSLFVSLRSPGLRLVPNLGPRSVNVGEHTAGRNGLLAEYVRRQTGVSLNRLECRAYLKTATAAASDSTRAFPYVPLSLTRPNRILTGLAVLRGFEVDFNSIVGKDWSPVLGPDLFPSVQHKMVSTGRTGAKGWSTLPAPLRTPEKKESSSEDDEDSAVSTDEAESETASGVASTSRKGWSTEMKQALERGASVLSSVLFWPR
jgi:hypothetical protein